MSLLVRMLKALLEPPPSGKKKQQHPRFGWDAGMRRLVSVTYRGTLLWGLLCMVSLGRAMALEYLQWADEFLSLADEELDPHLGGENAYVEGRGVSERGSAFLPSLRRGLCRRGEDASDCCCMEKRSGTLTSPLCRPSARACLQMW